MPDADLTKRILKAVDDGFDDQVAFTADLTRMPSLRGREAPAQDLMARAMELTRGLVLMEAAPLGVTRESRDSDSARS